MKLSVLINEAQFHGARRLKDKHGWCWAIALGCFMLLCSFLVVVLILRYLDNPTHLVLYSFAAEVMPFPMVMICPEITFPEYRVNNFLNNIKFPVGMSKTTIRKLLPQLAAFYALDMKFNTLDLVRLQNLLDYNEIDLAVAAKTLTSSCEESIIRCQWRGQIANCSMLFEMKLTGTGFCCVFNGRSLRSDMQRGQHHRTPRDEWFTRINGHLSELALVVNQSQKLNNIDLSYKWIVMQQSQYFVDVVLNGTALSPGNEHWFGFSSQGFQLSDSSKELSASLRKCRTFEEAQNLYFPVYSVEYCLLECEMTLTIRHCGCIKLTHPKIPGKSYCRALSLMCARRIIVTSSSRECECPQVCNKNMVETQSTIFPLSPNLYSFSPLYDNITTFHNISIVKVFVSTYNKKTFARQSVFNYMLLFSQVGGTFNVYLGCSVLTLVELAMLCYHGLLRRNNEKPIKSKAKIRRHTKKLLNSAKLETK